MTLNKLFAASVLVGTSVFAAQSAMAYGQGDVYARADVVKSDITASGKFDDENTWNGAIGVMPFDKLGVELSGSNSNDYDGSNGDSFKMKQYNIMAQYYPLGGTDSRVQPYAGLGASYVTFNDSSLNGGADSFEKRQWAPTAQVGTDLLITDNWALNGFVQYTDLKADYNGGGDRDIDPLTVGGGVSFRF